MSSHAWQVYVIANEHRQPPPSFQPQLPPTATTAPNSSSADTEKSIDLITRYNLSARVGGAENGSQEEDVNQSQNQGIWAESRSQRQELLRRRREEMVLAARRNFEKESKGKS